ncbi:MAG: NADH-quinone oxidoreductase subunit H [Chloroflexota bacterium]
MAGACVALLVAYAYVLRLERQVIARMALGGERRWGALWPLMDALRALGKRTLLPAGGARLLCRAAPALALAPVLVAFAALPGAPSAPVRLARAWLPGLDAEVSLLAPLAASLLGLCGVALYARATRQEAARGHGAHVAREGALSVALLLLAMVGASLVGGGLGLEALADAQARSLPYVVYQPLGFGLCLLALARGPRRLPVALPGPAPDGLAGFHLQHAGAVLALFHLGDYWHLFLMSGLLAAVYLGGGYWPWASGPHWLAAKAAAVALGALWLRHGLEARAWEGSVPAWPGLMLLALGNAIVTAILLTV